MTDFLFILIAVGFFGLTVAFVRLIEWIVGPDAVDVTPPLDDPAQDAGDDRSGLTA